MKLWMIQGVPLHSDLKDRGWLIKNNNIDSIPKISEVIGWCQEEEI